MAQQAGPEAFYHATNANPVGYAYVYGFDVAEAAQIRRIRSLIDAGLGVRSATMRRKNMNLRFAPEWPNFHLRDSSNNKMLRRLADIFASILKMRREAGKVDEASFIVARNFDMLVIAWAVRLVFQRKSPPLVYECLDIHGLFTRDDFVGAAFRWFERRLLRRVDHLIVSSDRFIDAYFKPKQGYDGDYTVLENKIYFGPSAPERRSPVLARGDDAPISIGWVGTIRCAPSMAILMGAADRLGDKVRIDIFGAVHRTVLPAFDADVAARENVVYHGPYEYPHGLEQCYHAIDIVWAQDLWQRGANSDWLLPNRIYEASWYGCPSVAVADTETGRRIEGSGIGFVVPEATVDALAKLVENLDRHTIRKVSERLLDAPVSEFAHTSADVRDVFVNVGKIPTPETV